MSTTSERINKQAVKLTDDVHDLGSSLKNAAQEQVGQLHENLAERYEQGQHTILDAACSCEKLIRQRPFQSLLVAAGVGMLFGRFWKRR